MIYRRGREINLELPAWAIIHLMKLAVVEDGDVRIAINWLLRASRHEVSLFASTEEFATARSGTEP